MPHIELSNLLWLIEIFVPSIDQTLFVVISGGNRSINELESLSNYRYHILKNLHFIQIQIYFQAL